MPEPISDEVIAAIREAILAGKKIRAIKLYRDASGANLVEAKAFVERAEAESEGREAEPGLAADDIELMQEAVFAGAKIKAIKIYRNATGEGLKQSRLFIEALEDELRRTDPTRFTAPTKAKGCGLMIGLGLGVGGVIAALF